jgi:hypothetical protein
MMFLDEHTLRIISEEGFDTLFDIRAVEGDEPNRMSVISTCRIDNHDVINWEDDHAILEQAQLDQGSEVFDRLIRKNALFKVTKRHIKNLEKHKKDFGMVKGEGDSK